MTGEDGKAGVTVEKQTSTCEAPNSPTCFSFFFASAEFLCPIRLYSWEKSGIILHFILMGNSPHLGCSIEYRREELTNHFSLFGGLTELAYFNRGVLSKGVFFWIKMENLSDSLNILYSLQVA